MSSHEALALNALFKGPGWNVIEFEQWTRLRQLRDHWIAGASKTAAVDTVRTNLRDSKAELRIEGPGGIGKTRLALESLCDAAFRSLVVYAAEGAHVSPEILNYLMASDRPLILVVDECSSEDHALLAKRLSIDSKLRLLTIGRQGEYRLSCPIISAGKLTERELEEYLATNHKGVSPEAARILSRNADGNVGYAKFLAIKVASASPEQIATLIQRGDVAQFVSDLVPGDGDPFLVLESVSLFEKVGWDGDMSSEADQLATYVGIAPERFRRAAKLLEERGFLERYGRFRGVAPQPVAVLFAALAWRERSNDIVDRLMPHLSSLQLQSLMRRAADLGTFGPTRAVLSELLSSQSTFGTLSSIEEHDASGFLIQMAIVAPDETSRHMSDMIRGASLDDLRLYHKSRRNIVWALEKLAWHSRLFVDAADDLLRLALAEIESYANNATGTWLRLFGAILPATAADPDARLEYLGGKVESEDSTVRLLAVKALAAGLSVYESNVVSAEDQGGSFLEPRGSVKTVGQLVEYRTAILRFLRGLSRDSDPEVRSGAVQTLIKSIHPFLQEPYLSEVLDAILQFDESEMRLVRKELAHLAGLFDRVSDGAQRDAIAAFEARLPGATPLERLRQLLETEIWEFDSDERREEFGSVAREVQAAGDLAVALAWLREQPLPSSWFLGRYLAGLTPDSVEPPLSLIEAAERNPNALLGFLSWHVDQGDAEAFDRFLDGDEGQALPANLRLAITGRGPGTGRAVERARQMLSQVTGAEAVGSLFGWHHQLSLEQRITLIPSLVGRISDTRDYASVVSWTSHALYETTAVTAEIEEILFSLIELRLEYPDFESERWNWCRLARLLVKSSPLRVAELILSVIETGSAPFIASDEEAALMREAALAQPARVWKVIAGHLRPDSWRMQLALRGWITDAFPGSVIVNWVGKSRTRAEVVARVANPGSLTPTDVAAHLITNFPGNKVIGSELAGQFMSGFWTGSASSHYAQQAAELRGWQKDLKNSKEVRDWAGALATDIEQMRDRAVRMEAEGEFGI